MAPQAQLRELNDKFVHRTLAVRPRGGEQQRDVDEGSFSEPAAVEARRGGPVDDHGKGAASEPAPNARNWRQAIEPAFHSFAELQPNVESRSSNQTLLQDCDPR